MSGGESMPIPRITPQENDEFFKKIRDSSAYHIGFILEHEQETCEFVDRRIMSDEPICSMDEALCGEYINRREECPKYQIRMGELSS